MDKIAKLVQVQGVRSENVLMMVCIYSIILQVKKF